MKITEEYIHYLWKQQLFPKQNLVTSDGEEVDIIHPGDHNEDSGPDFFNAKVKINDTLWAGNVEIHLRSSDWHRHNHHKDRSYDSVILQVALENDKETFRTSGEKIPTVEMTIDLNMFERYNLLMENEMWIPCAGRGNDLDDFLISFWLEKLSIERLSQKTKRIRNKLRDLNNDWEEGLYFFLLSIMGFKINSEPFEMIAQSLPYAVLRKQKHSRQQIEAMLFGQAGMLEQQLDDDYYIGLKKEYEFLKYKHKLAPIEKHLWKFMRLRPNNFPTIRIAQLAALFNNVNGLFSRVLEATKLKDLKDIFEVEVSDYWLTHYNFGKNSAKKRKVIGKDAFFVIVINTVIPFLFVYGKSKVEEKYCERALELMEEIPAEKNRIIENWAGIGIKAKNARQSQALIQLKKNYCDDKKCLSCQIGNELLKKNELF